MPITRTPSDVQPFGEAQRVVAADRDQILQAQVADVFQHDRRQVVNVFLHAQRLGFFLAQVRRQRGAAHLRGIGARGMQHRPAGAIDAPRVVAVEGPDIFRIELRSHLQMRQPFPPAANADDLQIHVRGLVDHALDHRVQPGNIAPAG